MNVAEERYNCSTDPELFGEGVFEILESKLKSGQIPCGCSGRGYHFSKEQYEIVCKRFADRHGWGFVGWSGKLYGGTKKKYLLSCKTCAMDEELFGQGFFSGEKGNLIKGQGVCGCAKYVRWNPEQMSIRCRREAKNRGYSFSGFTSDYKNVDDTLGIVTGKQIGRAHV